MAWVISNWKGLVGGKKWVGVSWMRTHRAHTQALYTVTIKHTAHHTLPGNCLDIFIVETLTWKIQRLYHCDNPVPYSLMRLLWIKRNFVTLQKSFCSLHVSGARYNIGICVCRSFFISRVGERDGVCESSWLCGRKDDCHSLSPSEWRWQVMEVKMTLVSVVMRRCGG